jgi:hypothetical protein
VRVRKALQRAAPAMARSGASAVGLPDESRAFQKQPFDVAYPASVQGDATITRGFTTRCRPSDPGYLREPSPSETVTETGADAAPRRLAGRTAGSPR